MLVVLYDCCAGQLPSDTECSSALVGASPADTVLQRRSRGVVAAEVDRHPAILVVEHRDELQAGAERFEVLTQRRHAQVVGVLELGDRPLGHVEAAGELGLAGRLTVTKLVQPDLP